MKDTLTQMDKILSDVNWCKDYQDPIQMATNMIITHANDSVSDEEKFGSTWTEFHHEKMIHWAKVLRILKRSEI